MAHNFEAPRRLDEGHRPGGTDTETKSSLLQRHLSLYNDLMKVQPQRHTEQQLKMEREQRNKECLQDRETELEKIRQKYQVDGGSKGGKDYLFDTDFETKRQEMIRRQRAMEKRRNDEEAYVIQEKTFKERKDKVTKPKWYEVKYQKKMMDVRARSEQVWNQGDKFRPYNIWDKRKEVHERQHRELEELLPKSEADEEVMLKRAIELSRQTAEQTAERVTEEVKKDSQMIWKRSRTGPSYSLVRTYEKRDKEESIWDIESDDSHDKNKPSDSHFGYAQALKKKRPNEVTEPQFIGKSKQLKEQHNIKQSLKPATKDSISSISSGLKEGCDNSMFVESKSGDKSRELTAKYSGEAAAQRDSKQHSSDRSVKESNATCMLDANNNNLRSSGLYTDSGKGEDWTMESDDWYLYCGPQYDGQQTNNDRWRKMGSTVNKDNLTLQNQQNRHPGYPVDSTKTGDNSIAKQSSTYYHNFSSDSGSSSDNDDHFHFPSVSFVASKKDASNKQVTINESQPLPQRQKTLKNVTGTKETGSQYKPLFQSAGEKPAKKFVRFANDERGNDHRNHDSDTTVSNIVRKDSNLGKDKITSELKRTVETGKKEATEKCCKMVSEGVQTFDQKEFSSVIQEVIWSDTVKTKTINDVSCSKTLKEKEDYIVKSGFISKESSSCKIEKDQKLSENQLPPEQTATSTENTSHHDNIPLGLPEHLYQSYFDYLQSQNPSLEIKTANTEPPEELPRNQTISEPLSNQTASVDQTEAFYNPLMNPFILANCYTPETLTMMMKQAQDLLTQCQIAAGTQDSGQDQAGETDNDDHKNVESTHLRDDDNVGLENEAISVSINQIENNSEQNQVPSNDIEDESTNSPQTVHSTSPIKLKGRLHSCERNLRIPKFPAVATRLNRKNLLALDIDPTQHSCSKKSRPETSAEFKTSNVSTKDFPTYSVINDDVRKEHTRLQSCLRKNDHDSNKQVTDADCGWVETGDITCVIANKGYHDDNDRGNQKGFRKSECWGTETSHDYKFQKSDSQQYDSNIPYSSYKRTGFTRHADDDKLSSAKCTKSVQDSREMNKAANSDYVIRSPEEHNRLIRNVIRDMRKKYGGENEVTDSGDASGNLRYF